MTLSGRMLRQRAYVKALVRRATDKEVADRLANLSLMTLPPPRTASYSGPDLTHGATCHQLAVPISGGPGRAFLRLLT